MYEEPISEDIYSRIIFEDDLKNNQIRLTINCFRGVEYIHLRKYYMDYDEVWMPSNEGIAMPLDISNSRELFAGLVEILSLAESKSILEEEFKDLLDTLYLN